MAMQWMPEYFSLNRNFPDEAVIPIFSSGRRRSLEREFLNFGVR